MCPCYILSSNNRIVGEMVWPEYQRLHSVPILFTRNRSLRMNDSLVVFVVVVEYTLHSDRTNYWIAWPHLCMHPETWPLAPRYHVSFWFRPCPWVVPNRHPTVLLNDFTVSRSWVCDHKPAPLRKIRQLSSESFASLPACLPSHHLRHVSWLGQEDADRVLWIVNGRSNAFRRSLPLLCRTVQNLCILPPSVFGLTKQWW